MEKLQQDIIRKSTRRTGFPPSFKIQQKSFTRLSGKSETFVFNLNPENRAAIFLQCRRQEWSVVNAVSVPIQDGSGSCVDLIVVFQVAGNKFELVNIDAVVSVQVGLSEDCI